MVYNINVGSVKFRRNRENAQNRERIERTQQREFVVKIILVLVNRDSTVFTV